MTKKALVMVDLQNDFCSGGSLAVPEGEKVIAVANQIQPYFDLIIATKDWHPANHMSFASNHPGKKLGDIIHVGGMTQILWPAHCIQNTKGADFHPSLNTERITKIIYKGVDEEIDSYSAFFDNERRRTTGLFEYLQKEAVTEVYILGLATDYCVKYTCLDALHLGVETIVIVDGCCGVETNPGDTGAALQAMKTAGAKLMTSSDLG